MKRSKKSLLLDRIVVVALLVFSAAVSLTGIVVVCTTANKGISWLVDTGIPSLVQWLGERPRIEDALVLGVIILASIYFCKRKQ